MKKTVLSLLIIVTVFTLCFSLVACNTQTKTAYAFSVENLTDNPDRGFRGECYLTLGRYGTWPGDTTVSSPTAALDAELDAYPENIHIIQQYIYLIDYYNSDLDSVALSQLTTYFEYARSKNVKFLLRFAYEYAQFNGWVGPSVEQILQHITTLKGWLDNNLQLFNDVVYSVQLGMIGLWGEGHTSVNNTHKSVKEIMTAMAEFIPEPYTIMLRYSSFYKSIPEGLENRFGMNEDWLVGRDKDLYDFYRYFDASYKDEVTNWCRTSVNDAEMPWGRDETITEFDALQIVRQLASHSISTLSIAHNYIEDEGYRPGDYFLHQCKSIYLTEQELVNNALPYRAELLTDGKITVFDYLTYHLGYLLTVNEIASTKKEKTFTIENYGFAAPVYYTLQVIDDNGAVLKECALNDLTSGKSKNVSVKTQGNIRIKIVHKSNDAYTIKLANDVPYENGINVFKTA